jgi:CubicO group peptidase (beta-lactamase class C family)
MHLRTPAAAARTAGLLALGLALAAGPGAAAPAAPETSTAAEDVERVLAAQLDSSRVPGGAYAVVTGGQVDADGVGTAGDADATAATPFVIGSTTKSLTALAVMQLVDAGDVALDARVRDYVPELSLAAGEPVDAITVRHLLQQTSGLDDLTGGPLLASATDGTPLEAVAELAGAELASPPGATWRYANVNYVLAGLVVERASGMSYADYLEQRIFAPLGMDDSTARGRPVDASPGHRFWFGVPLESGPTVRRAVMAAGYVVSTADDLGRYLEMYLAEGLSRGGTRLVSATGLRTLLSPGPEATLGPWADGMPSRYAMGWFVGGPWSADAIFHPGNSPDSSAMLALLPGEDTGVVSLVNAGHELPVPGNPALTDRMARNVVHAAVGEPVPDPPSLTAFYLVFDLVSLLLLLAAGRGLALAVSAWRGGAHPRHPARAVVGVVLRVLASAVLVLAPGLLGGWPVAWTWAPDLVLVLACLGALLAGTAALRLGLLLRRGSGPSASPGVTPASPGAWVSQSEAPPGPRPR